MYTPKEKRRAASNEKNLFHSSLSEMQILILSKNILHLDIVSNIA